MRLPLITILAAALLLSPGVTAQNRPQFEVRLPSRTFIPPARIPADLETRVRGLRQAQNLERVHVIVQFAKPLEPADRRRIEAQGLRLLNPINKTTWYASVTTLAATTLRGVRWADLIRPADRISRLVSPTPQEYQRREGGRVAYSVLFHKDVRAAEVQALADRLGARLEEFEPRAFAVVRTATFVIPPSAFAALTEADIVAVIEPSSPPHIDDNVASAQPLSNIDDIQAAPFGLTGTGINVGVWEAGDVIDTASLDLAGRVTVQPGQVAGSDDHSSHVAGTIGASGVNVPLAEGMAPAVNILSWDSGNDAVEMTNAAALPAPPRVSNHSYGPSIGWTSGVFNNNQNLFGNYTNDAQDFDNVVTATGLIVMKSAGNDRDDGPGAPGQPFDCTQGGLGVQADCIGPEGVAKNVITVGAMNGAGAIAGFSSFGPTDDGRIKPDVVAQGFNMLSLACSNCFSDGNGDGVDDVPDSTTGSYFNGGTSMSTPVVTGTAALILEEAARRNITVTPEGMKALLIQTARDVTGIGQSNPGPDFATGWGIVDAQNAVNLLRQGGLRQATLTDTGPGNAWTATVFVPAGTPELHVTLAWSDPSAIPGNPVLINDLDLRLIAPDATTFTPWTLDPAAPATAAVRNGGNDATNNVEQVSVLTPVSGVWTVQVSADPGNLPQAPQNFAVSGVLPRSDIVLVMDRSGSMAVSSGEPGITKIMALQSAANEFIDLLDLGGGATLGLVQFEENVVPFVPAFDLQPLGPGNLGDAHTAVDDIDVGGMTNIIGGVEAAITQLSGAGSPAPRQSIVVFSDGQHNRPIGSDLNSIGPSVQGGNYRFYSIGFGTDVDDAILTSVANASGGIHVNDQDLSPIQLTKHFLTVGALVHDLTVLADPMWELRAGESATLSTTATTLDRSLIFAVNWTGQQARNVGITLTGPGGQRCSIPQSTRAGNWYRLIRVDLPYDCNGRRVHAGKWTIRVTPEMRGTAKEKVDITILGQSRLRLDSVVKFDKAKRQYVLTAMFTENGKPIRRADGMSVNAELLSPLPRTFNGERLDKDGRDDRPKTATPRNRRIQQVRLQPGLSTDGFTTIFDAAKLEPGLNQVRVIATMKRGDQEIRRESIATIHVEK